jgi:holo-[acyl-carrier protein] synthase
MSIFGIGIDLCEVERVTKSLDKLGDRFVDKILHPNEKVRFNELKFQARFLAKRFAAKEAFAKAMGTGIAQGVSFANIEVFNDENGKPGLRLHGATQQKLAQIGDCKVHLSISDERQTAVAQVIIERF